MTPPCGSDNCLRDYWRRVKAGRGVFTDYTVKRYASRLALESFLRNPGDWYALVKTPTERNMVIHPAFQTAI